MRPHNLSKCLVVLISLVSFSMMQAAESTLRLSDGNATNGDQTTSKVASVPSSNFTLQEAADSWTVSVAPSDAYGGYVEKADGTSQCDVAYSTTWPASGYVPVHYIHFPAGTFTVTTGYGSGVNVTVSKVTLDGSGERTLEQKYSGTASSFSFTADTEAYYRFALTGGTPGSTTLQDYTVSGTVSGTNRNSNVWMAGWRSAPSTHIWGFTSTDTDMPSGNAFDWVYSEIQIPTGYDYYGTYIEAYGWTGGANNAGGGYIGMQNNGPNGGTTNRTIIFSAWDNGDTDSDPTLADYKKSGIIATGTADNVTAERFGGEGTGVHILLNGNLWQAGQWVKFLVNSRPEQIELSDGTLYNNTILSAWYKAEGIDSDWHFIGSMRVAGTIIYINPNNSFLEEFTRGNTSQGNAVHKAYYRHYFSRAMQSGAWYNRNGFSYSNTDNGTDDGKRNDCSYTTTTIDGVPTVVMKSGGYTSTSVDYGTESMDYVEPDGIVPTDAVLKQLLVEDVEPAIQAQNEERMELAIEAAITTKLSGWTASAVSSDDGENTKDYAIDENTNTFWQSNWLSGNYPQHIVFYNEDAPTVSEIILTLPDNEYYHPKNATVAYSTDGTTFTNEGTYTLNTGNNAVELASAINAKYIKVTFNEANSSSTSNAVRLIETSFYTLDKSVATIKALAKSYLDNAGKFNGYNNTDATTLTYLNALQTVYDNASATYNDVVTALSNLAENGKLIKYGVVNAVASLSAEKAYVIRNKYGYGDMVGVSTNDTYPTLRNGDANYYATLESTTGTGKRAYEATYCTAQSVLSELNNWMIVSATGDDAGYYYIYNMDKEKYLTHNGTVASYSSSPAAMEITYNSTYDAFNFRMKGSSSAQQYACAAPQFAESNGSIRAWTTGDAGSLFYIYDNFAITPSDELVAKLRLAAGLISNVKVTYHVKDADGTLVKSFYENYAPNTTVTEYPTSMTGISGVTYSPATPSIELGSANQEVDVIYSYDLFQPSTETTKRYYHLAVNGAKYLSTRTIQVGDGLCLPNYMTGDEGVFGWALEGNPFDGTYIVYSANGKYLKANDNAPAITTNAEEATAWTLTHGSGNFKLKSGSNKNWNDFGGYGVLKYWSTDGSNIVATTIGDEKLYVTWNIKDTSGELLHAVVTAHDLNDEISSFPDGVTDYTNKFVNISTTCPTFTVTENTSVDLTASIDLPFYTSTSTESPVNYYIHHVANNKYVTGEADESHSSTLALSTTAPAAAADATTYKWAFIGNPFDGYALVNASTGKEVNSGVSYAITDNNYTHPNWDVVKDANTTYKFQVRFPNKYGDNYYYWNDYSGYSYIQGWHQDNNNGNLFEVQIADPITITWNFYEDGDESKATLAGTNPTTTYPLNYVVTAYPSDVIAYKQRYVVLSDEDNVSVTMDESKTVDVPVTYNLPFTVSTSEDKTYYFWRAAGSSYIYWDTDNTGHTYFDFAKNAHKSHLWAFYGNPFDGFLIRNASDADKNLYGASVGWDYTYAPVLSDNETKWIILSTATDGSATTFSVRHPGHGSGYLNRYNENALHGLAYWSTTGATDANARFEVAESILQPEDIPFVDGYYRISSAYSGGNAYGKYLTNDGTNLSLSYSDDIQTTAVRITSTGAGYQLWQNDKYLSDGTAVSDNPIQVGFEYKPGSAGDGIWAVLVNNTKFSSSLYATAFTGAVKINTPDGRYVLGSGSGTYYGTKDGLTWTSNSTSGLEGLTLTATAGTWDVAGWNSIQNMTVKTAEAETPVTYTITAPEGKTITKYHIGAYNYSTTNYTISANGTDYAMGSYGASPNVDVTLDTPAQTATFTITADNTDQWLAIHTFYVELTPADASLGVRAASNTDWSSGWWSIQPMMPELHELDGKYYATAYMPFDYTLPEGTAAYIVTDVEDTEAIANDISNGVPAGTGVILVSEDEASMYLYENYSAGSTTGNLLTGTYSEMKAPASGAYVFSGLDGYAGLYKYTGVTLGAYKAYMPEANLTAAKKLRLIFGNQPTGISNARTVGTDDKVYDLQGRRIKQPQKGGVYIVNGKRVLF